MQETLRRSEETHKKTSEFLNDILSNMSDIVWMVDEDYNIRFCNDKAREIHGDIKGRKCYQILRNRDSPCYHAGTPCEVHEIIEKGKSYFEDTRLAQFTKKITHIRAKPTTPIEGKKAIISVARDVTDQKLAQEQLEKSFSVLQATLESTADGILVVNQNHKITNFNQKWLKMFNIPNSILSSLDCKELMKYLLTKIKDPNSFQKRTEDLFQNPDMETSDTFGWNDGRIYERNSRPHKINGKTVGRVISFRDLTNMRNAEKALRESAEFNSTLLNHAPYPILVLNEDTTIKYINPAVEKLTGFSKSELIGQKEPYPYWLKEFKEKYLKILQEQMTYGAQGYERQFQKKNGEKFWVEINATTILSNNKFNYYLSIWVDITKRKQIQDELQRYSDHLEQLVKEKTEELSKSELFIRSTIDRVPDLISIKDSNSKFMFINDSYSKFLGKSKDEIIGSTVYDLYSKEQADAFTAQDREVFEKGITILTHDICLIDVEGKEHIVQTIKTPIKDDKGRIIYIVSITRDLTERKAIEEKDYIKISVADTGMGIKSKDLGKVFKPFADIEKSSYIKGTGLGLSVSKGLVETHGGKMWVESDGEGRGATFTFTLPKTYITLKRDNTKS